MIRIHAEYDWTDMHMPTFQYRVEKHLKRRASANVTIIKSRWCHTAPCLSSSVTIKQITLNIPAYHRPHRLPLTRLYHLTAESPANQVEQPSATTKGI